MRFLVRCWKSKDGRVDNEFMEYMDLEDAKDYAKFKADQCRRYGYEFNVQIYELTDY